MCILVFYFQGKLYGMKLLSSVHLLIKHYQTCPGLYSFIITIISKDNFRMTRKVSGEFYEYYLIRIAEYHTFHPTFHKRTHNRSPSPRDLPNARFQNEQFNHSTTNKYSSINMCVESLSWYSVNSTVPFLAAQRACEGRQRINKHIIKY